VAQGQTDEALTYLVIVASLVIKSRCAVPRRRFVFSAKMQFAAGLVSGREEDLPASRCFLKAVRHCLTLEDAAVGTVASYHSAGDRATAIKKMHFQVIPITTLVALVHQ
jgi:hypothetical protein